MSLQGPAIFASGKYLDRANNLKSKETGFLNRCASEKTAANFSGIYRNLSCFHFLS